MVQAAGERAEVEIVVEKDPAQMWDLVTDVSRIGEWSPECVGGTWLDGAQPRAGARFEGRNDLGGGFRFSVTCVVTAAERPGVFEWVVLDPAGDPGQPGSIWRYDLGPGDAPGQCRVRHTFTHGPGVTGLSRAMADSPEQAAAILRERLDQLREHMTATIGGMAAS
jgi:uncharacterized protein YndB with AHSA1/START domain